MKTRMKSRTKIVSAALLAGPGIALVAVPGASQAAPDCDEVEGVLTGAFTGELSTAGTIDSRDKLLQGATTSFAGDDLAPSAGLDAALVPPATASYTGLLTISTPDGELTLRDIGIFDTDVAGGDGEFVSRSRVTSGSGVFTGSSGIIFFYGDTAPDFTFTADFSGTICVGDEG